MPPKFSRQYPSQEAQFLEIREIKIIWRAIFQLIDEGMMRPNLGEMN